MSRSLIHETEARTPPAVLPRAERAHQGNPAITAWCPTCKEQTIPMRSGACGFCDTKLEAPMTAPPVPELPTAERAPTPATNGHRPPAQGSQNDRIMVWFKQHERGTSADVAEDLGVDRALILAALGALVKRGLLHRVSGVPSKAGGRPQTVFSATPAAVWEPGRAGHAAAHERLRLALDEERSA